MRAKRWKLLDELPPIKGHKHSPEAEWREFLRKNPMKWAAIRGPSRSPMSSGAFNKTKASEGFEYARRRLADGYYMFARYVGPTEEP